MLTRLKKEFGIPLLIFLTMASIASAQFVTDSKGGKTFLADFSPNPNYSKRLSPVLSYYSTTGYVRMGATSSTAGQMWNSTTRDRANAIPVVIAAGSTVIRGTSPSSKYFIYSGLTGSLERQPDKE